MINIVTPVLNENEEINLDVLATASNYEVILSTMSDGSVNSTLCEGENAGALARDIIDKHYLLRDYDIHFPATQFCIYKICSWCIPSKVGM